MKIQRHALILILGLLALSPLKSGAYLGEVREKLLGAKGEAILEVGAMPVLLPSHVFTFLIPLHLGSRKSREKNPSPRFKRHLLAVCVY